MQKVPLKNEKLNLRNLRDYVETNFNVNEMIDYSRKESYLEDMEQG